MEKIYFIKNCVCYDKMDIINNLKKMYEKKLFLYLIISQIEINIDRTFT